MMRYPGAHEHLLHQINVPTYNICQSQLNADKFEQVVNTCFVDLTHQIDIGILARIAARDRAKQGERYDASSAQFRLMGLDPGNGFFAGHIREDNSNVAPMPAIAASTATTT